MGNAPSVPASAEAQHASAVVDAQHTALRSLFSQITEKKPMSWTADNSILQWEGVKLDGEGNVIEVFAQDTEMEGQLDNTIMEKLGTLLPHLKVLDLYGHMLSGPCSLDALPSQMELLYLRRDQKEDGKGLSGTLNTSKMPATLKYLALSNNNFSGPIDWEPLSKLKSLKSLEWLSLGGNAFEGTPQLQHLPRCLTHFSIQNCNFSGRVNLSELPSGITELYLYGNPLLNFVGDVAKFPLKLDADSKERLKEISITLNAGAAGESVMKGGEFLRLVLHETRADYEQRAADAERRVAQLEDQNRELRHQLEQAQEEIRRMKALAE